MDRVGTPSGSESQERILSGGILTGHALVRGDSLCEDQSALSRCAGLLLGSAVVGRGCRSAREVHGPGVLAQVTVGHVVAV